jgi:hypothetical protein
LIALIVGLVKPALVIRWSKKPTRLKALGWLLIPAVITLILILEIDTRYTPEECMTQAKKSISNGNYSTAINYLKRIKQEDVLYTEAQNLIANATAEEARVKAETEAKKKADAEAKAAENARKQAEAEAKAIENARKKAEADAAKAEAKAAEDARKKAEAEAKASEKATSTSTSSRNISPSSISSVEEANNYVNGKTFTATPAGGLDGLWHKVSFSNGSFSLWSTYPSSGKWGSPAFKGKYHFEEKRYSDTGQRYFLLRFTPEGDNGPLGCLAFNVKETSFMSCDDGAKAVEGDKNPWD